MAAEICDIVTQKEPGRQVRVLPDDLSAYPWQPRRRGNGYWED